MVNQEGGVQARKLIIGETRMKRSIFFTCLLLVTAVGLNAQENAFPKLVGPYLGQKPPGDTARPFAPAFFGTMFRSFHSGIIFTPDGNTAYWQAMVNDESKGQAIFESKVERGVWTNPRVAPFSELVRGGRDDSPFITPDGERLFFLSSRPVEKGGEAGAERIWVAKRAREGWSEPQLVPLNWNPADGRIHWRLSVDSRGDLYFGAWKIRGEEVTGEIFLSRYEGGKYGAPARLGPEINREGHYNFCPSVAPDGSYLIFTRIGPTVKDRLPDNLYCSFRDKDGKWTHAQKLQIPGDRGNDVPAISSNGKYLFMRHGLDQFYWVGTSLIEKLRPKE
jgi:hypothetical protein